MMQKYAKTQDDELNKVKENTDAQVAILLKLDKESLHEKVQEVSDAIWNAVGDDVLAGVSPRVVVAGGAGSGKSTFAADLSTTLGVKGFSFDQYIPGGFTEKKDEYERRFNKGMYELWEDLPQKKGWVIEHVESCKPEFLGLYAADFAILLDPGEEHLRKVVEARTTLQGGVTLARALTSAAKAVSQFEELKGEIVFKAPGVFLKQIES